MKKKFKEITLEEICKQCKKGNCILAEVVYCADCNICFITNDELEKEVDVEE